MTTKIIQPTSHEFWSSICVLHRSGDHDLILLPARDDDVTGDDVTCMDVTTGVQCHQMVLAAMSKTARDAIVAANELGDNAGEK